MKRLVCAAAALLLSAAAANAAKKSLEMIFIDVEGGIGHPHRGALRRDHARGYRLARL